MIPYVKLSHYFPLSKVKNMLLTRELFRNNRDQENTTGYLLDDVSFEKYARASSGDSLVKPLIHGQINLIKLI